jgi:hypothetical protein
MESFFFADAKFSGNIYLGMLENVAFLAVGRRHGNLFLQKLKHHIRQHTAADNTIRGVLGFGFLRRPQHHLI